MDFSTEQQNALAAAEGVNEATEAKAFTMQATYSPEDNKLRLYSAARLDAATYSRVSEAGFRFAPKQDLFVAPMWTPQREDLLLELCGEIGDEDTSLVDRAEERADRFSDYSGKRAGEAEAARKTVSSLSDGIPFGQPILVGHHSERRARKDAERIESGMRRAVKMWETAEYWKHRAAGALRHAKYKELPAVRHRRIKGLEAEKRKQERSLAEAQKFLALWQDEGLTMAQAQAIANHDYISRPFPLADYPRNPPASQYEGAMSLWSALNGAVITELQAREIAVRSHQRRIEWASRWIAHYDNRIAYERAMLDEQGGLKAEAFEIQPGGHVLVRGEWLLVKRVNKKDGRISSVTTNARFVPVRGIEEVKDYRPASEEEAAKQKAASKLPPMCNYPGEGFRQMTKAELDATHKDYKGSRELGQDSQRTTGSRPDIKGAVEVAALYARHRVRVVVHGGRLVPVFVSDAKRNDPPAAAPAPAEPATAEGGRSSVEPCGHQAAAQDCSKPSGEDRQVIDRAAGDAGAVQDRAAGAGAENPGAAFKAMREQLKAGVQVVSAPQLFPTPAALAVRMAELAEIEAGHSVLEPSAGTGSILSAVRAVASGSTIRTAVEINAGLCRELRRVDPGAHVFHADFLTWKGGTSGAYDRILMNPPFLNAQDIEHIKRALQMLRPGGRLVAICANGPRQNAQLRPLVEQHGGEWEELPPGTFKDSGTGVNTVLLSIRI